MIAFGPDVCRDFADSSNREWLETNGIGGYASSTVAGVNTRRYHGLLVAATRPPVGRTVLLSKFEETLILGDARYELSCNQYPGKVHPEGFRFLTGFRLDPFPVWTYEAGGVEVEKTLFMVHGENTIVCRWAIKRTAANARLELRPLVAFRDHHHLRNTRQAGILFDNSPGMVSVGLGTDGPELYLAHNADAVAQTGDWYNNFEYAIERERGFDYHEDLYQPCVFSFDLTTDPVVIGSTSDETTRDADALAAAERCRREKLIEISGATDPFTKQLVLAADQFIVSRGSGKTVIAGYHWFSDWGRDTMIALPGLTLATRRSDVARDILLEFSRNISEGMLPNRFPDEGGQADYNTVDATLWYFDAIRAYLGATGDDRLVRELYPKLIDIIDWHVHGTRFGIRVDDDGLLYSGERGMQLTWMDAKVGDRVITPRTGKAVEIQALWYNALRIMVGLAGVVGEKGSRFSRMANIAKQSFNLQFWNEAAGCLYDVVDGDTKDGSIRPNQIFAVGLTHSMLSKQHARRVVNTVEAELLTPVGLRSLSPRDSRYVGRYIGPPEERDSAYHQGTVWAWLIGPFIDAYRRVHPKGRTTETRIRELLSGFERHLAEAGAGQISEIFDGDEPHKARGAVAQAWSVAEVLRISRGLSGEMPRE